MSSAKALVTLVVGASAALREAAIAAKLQPATSASLILEGLSSGTSPLDTAGTDPLLHISRIAPGCLCCTGNLTMRVTLNRLLRQRPARVYISLANTEHLERIRHFLMASPYDELLELTQDLSV